MTDEQKVQEPAPTAPAASPREATSEPPPAPVPAAPPVESVVVGPPGVRPPFTHEPGVTAEEFAKIMGGATRMAGFLCWVRDQKQSRRTVAEWKAALAAHDARTVR